MKKIALLILNALILTILFGCVNEKQISNLHPKESDVREAVWNQLSSKDKEQLQGTWQDGKASKIVFNENTIIMLNENRQIISAKSLIDKEVYIVDFTTKGISRPNNMIVYASMKDCKIIGYGIAD